jgi:hypothetical protein
MAGLLIRGAARCVTGSVLICVALLLVGCADYARSEFTTNADVALRLTQADDSTITARVPRGTPVERLGWVGGECTCWLVTTPYGAGWVYTRYLDLRLADSQLQ